MKYFVIGLFVVFTSPCLAQGGLMDSTFSNDGFIHYSFTGTYTAGIFNNIFLLDDGKILLAGQTSGYASHGWIVLTRLLTDGTPDPLFGDNGVVILGGYPETYNAADAALDSAGRILIAITYKPFGASNAGIICLHPDGSVDSTFGTDGVSFIETDSVSIWTAGESIAIQEDQKVILAAQEYGSDENILVARFTSDGTLDSTFNLTGIRKLDVSNDDEVSDVIIQCDGKIVVGGQATTYMGYNMIVLRMKSDGSSDTGYGYSGIFFNTAYESEQMQSLIPTPDSSYMVTGTVFPSDSAIQITIKIKPHLIQLDSLFSEDGFVYSTAPGFGSTILFNGKLMPDNKLLFCGHVHINDSPTPPRLALHSLNYDGTNDLSFGLNGWILMNIDSTVDESGYDVAVQPDGKLMIAGRVDIPLTVHPFCARIINVNVPTMETEFPAVQSTHWFDVYPNPAGDWIKISGEIKSGYLLELYDLSGKQIWSVDLTGDKAGEMVSLSYLDGGAYIYHITNGTKILHRGKLIVE